MLVPGDHLPVGRLGGGQAGAGAEGPPVADGVLEAVEEPVGEGLVPERLAVLAAVDGPPDPVPAAAAVVADLLDVPEPDVVTVHLLLSPVRLACLFQAAQPRGQRAAPDPHAAAGQPHDRRAGSLPAPAVERGPRHPQLGDHLLDRQQRVARGAGSCGRGGGGPAGSGARSRGRPVRGSATTDAPLRPPRQVRPPPGTAHPSGAAGPGSRRNRRGGSAGRDAGRPLRRGGAWRAARPCRRGRPAGQGAGSRAVTCGAALPGLLAAAGRWPAGRAGWPPARDRRHPPSTPPALSSPLRPARRRPWHPAPGPAGRVPRGGHGGACRAGTRHRRTSAR